MKRENTRTTKQSPANETATDLAYLIAPLLHVRGITVRQFCAALRVSAVKYAVSTFSPRRPNIARISFSSGLTRGEVSKLLKQPSLEVESDIHVLLTAWKQNRRFIGADGQPLDLPVFGESKSLEQLVKTCAKGLPVRAVLDELLARDLVELLPGQIAALRRLPATDFQGRWLEEALRSLHTKATRKTKSGLKDSTFGDSSRRNLKRKTVK